MSKPVDPEWVALLTPIAEADNEGLILRLTAEAYVDGAARRVTWEQVDQMRAEVERRRSGFASTGETRAPVEGEWFACIHPECQTLTRLHRAEASSFPYPAREIFREVSTGPSTT